MTTLRPLGSTGLSIAPLVLGGNVFGWTIDRETSFAVLDAFVAGGGTMIDTADVYSVFAPGNKGGESETLIGEWIAARGRRDDVQIATKVGIAMPDGEGLSAAWIARSIDDSLRRLRTDHIDLYYAHKDDEATPLDETLAAFDRLVKGGKVRAIAASNYSAARLSEALDISAANGLASYGALQPGFNLVDRHGFDASLQQLCIDRGLGVVPYFALASGFLTGKYRRDADIQGARKGIVERYASPAAYDLLDVMDAVSQETGLTLAQIALAWLAAQPGITAPIASATSVAQTEELIAGASASLNADQLDRLTHASEAVTRAKG
ncbi:aldo/keto reductase [Sphingobium chlorophenolicum]|uniref:Aldo/keto reductase n=1 Tax=Sphingobium chlorophenolicum TaxID=46429 RepID=A0A081RJB0_SPHCR|nr:aldo/keto reductase [Sphingobium chlorophenolicum]KEQ55283.1 Aldo/keto reductase precursor [Sphingobium chlorophenolicum]